jgi:long-chain fatty acid transport protein
MARGGAFTAKADNPAAINYNPAGFAKLRGHQAALSMRMVYSQYSFLRVNPPNGIQTQANNPYPAISKTNPLFVAPAPLHLVLSTDLGMFDKWTFAGGYYAPAVIPHEYPETVNFRGQTIKSPQRYDLTKFDGLLAFVFGAVAYRPFDWLAVGLTLQNVVTPMLSIKMTSVSALASGMFCSGSKEDPACDVDVEMEVSNWFAPTGSLGVWLRPMDNVEAGLSLRLPSQSTLTGKMKAKMGEKLSSIKLSNSEPSIELTNPYPLMLQAGIRYIFADFEGEFADIEADFDFQNWSQASIRQAKIDAKIASPMPMDIKPIEMDWHLLDTFSFRLGGSYKLRINPKIDLFLSGGAFTESESTSLSANNLWLFGAKRFGLSGGIGLRWNNIDVELAYCHLMLPRRNVKNSTVLATDVLAPGKDQVGNGSYIAAADMLSLQLGITFDSGTRPTSPEPHEEIEEEPIRLVQHEKDALDWHHFVDANAPAQESPDALAELDKSSSPSLEEAPLASAPTKTEEVAATSAPPEESRFLASEESRPLSKRKRGKKSRSQRRAAQDTVTTTGLTDGGGLAFEPEVITQSSSSKGSKKHRKRRGKNKRASGGDSITASSFDLEQLSSGTAKHKIGKKHQLRSKKKHKKKRKSRTAKRKRSHRRH